MQDVMFLWEAVVVAVGGGARYGVYLGFSRLLSQKCPECHGASLCVLEEKKNKCQL